MDGLNYDDIEKMLASQEWRDKTAAREGKRSVGRYLDVVRPESEMRPRMTEAVTVTETVTTTVVETPASTPETTARTANTLEDTEIDDIMSNWAEFADDKDAPKGSTDEPSSLASQKTEPETAAAESFLGADAPNPFLPDATLRVTKRPLGRDATGVEPGASGTFQAAQKPVRAAGWTVYAGDKVSDALTKDMADSSLEREADAALATANKTPKRRVEKGRTSVGLIIFFILMVIVFGGIAGYLCYYLFFR